MDEIIEEKPINTPDLSKKESPFLELFRFLIISFVIVFGVRMFIAQPFIVNGASMVPTFHNGEYLIIDELSYRFRNPERGEVIVFKYPEDPSKYFIKRIIGLPGETVEIIDNRIKITRKDNDEGIILEEPYIGEAPTRGKGGTLGQNEYFVMGDNREASSDSRSWGNVPEKNIIGRALVRLMPVAQASILPGDFSDQVEQ